MEGSNVEGSLFRLQQILAGRTIKDLLSNVDTKLLPQTGAEDSSKAVDLESSLAPMTEKTKTKDEDKEKKKKKKKKEKKEKKDKDKEKKKKSKNLRYAAGEVWEDQSMEDWPENDYRIFCGNLGNEVTDEMLALAFRKYPSFNRAKVVRDRKTSKTKGFGFVSIMKADDYIKAMKEMNNQYIGNRPVKLVRSKWKDRAAEDNKEEIKDAVWKKVKKN